MNNTPNIDKIHCIPSTGNSISILTKKINPESQYVVSTNIDHTADAGALRIIISCATHHNLWLYFYDVSNTFQTNGIEDPSKRHYLSLPPLFK